MNFELRFGLGFLGAGNMAEAIARAAIEARVMEPARIIVADPSPERRALFAGLGIATTEDGAEVVRQSAQVVLAVKPQMAPQVYPLLAAQLRPEQVVLSIMAGVTTARIEAALGRAARVVRVMPNTPMLVRAGMAGVALGAHAQPDDAALALRLFGAAGRAVQVDEARMDAVTAVSGSGPAYLFYLAEAMEEAARRLGLGEHARTLVAQTLVGAARLYAESPDSAAELRRKVTSPGGTTEAAIKHLEARAAGAAVVDAVLAAEARGRELGR